jgi:DNA topoisomerase I
MAFQEFEKFDTTSQAKKNIVQAIESVAKKLGNTPTICRKCYIHPAIIDGYLDGTIAKVLKRRAEKKLREEIASMRPEEAAVIAFLQQRLSNAA